MDTQPYCKFEWPVEPLPGIESVCLTFETFEPVEEKLRSMCPPMPDDDGGPVGEAVLLTQHGGQLLKVGISPVGWMLKIINPQYGRFGGQTIYALVEYDENYELGFNDPAYTDYPNTVLHDSEYAIKMIKRWLDTGTFPVFLAPNRNLGLGLNS